MNTQAEIEEVLPLTPSQEGMLLELLRGDAEPGILVGVLKFEIVGAVKAVEVKRALDGILQSRPALRASFVWKGLKRPIQAIARDIQVPFKNLDWSQLPKDAQERNQAELIATEQRRRFDLSRAPLMRFFLVKTAKDRHMAVWVLHHTICDGWSVGCLLQEFAGRLAGKDYQIDKGLRRYLAWRKKQDTTSSVAFWGSYFDKAEPAKTIELCGSTDSAMVHFPRGNIEFEVSADLDAKISAHARSLRMTAPNLIAAVFALCLRRYGAGDDVLFGMTNAGRPADVPDLDKAVGAFVNTLPVRIKVDPGTTLGGYFKTFEQSMQQRRDHELSALRDVVAASGLRTGRDVFKTIFAYEGLPTVEPENSPVMLSDVELTSADARADVSLLYFPGAQPRIQIEYDAALYSKDGAQTFTKDFLWLLEHVMSDQNCTVRDVMRGAFPPLANDVFETDQIDPVHVAFSKQAQKNPDAIALISEEGSMSYGELLEASNAVADALVKEGVGKGDIVPVIAERGHSAIIGILGVLRAGAAYVAVDPAYPEARNLRILEQIEPKIVLAAENARDGLTDRFVTQRIDKGARTANFTPAIGEDSDLAYVLFTSGSQGLPKGAEITQRNLAYSTQVRSQVYGRDPACFMVFSSLAFDSSVAGLFWSLATGGTLALAPAEALRDPHRTLDLIKAWKVDFFLCLPSLYRAFLEADRHNVLSSVDTVIVAGEPLDAHVIDRHREMAPNVRLMNEYGPTEATVWCTYFDASKFTGSSVPIGRPIPGSQILIGDPDGARLPPETAGEIIVRGPGVFAGYRDDAQKTQHVTLQFGEDRETRFYRTGDLGRFDGDGNLHFLGRIDQQIKIRGHRVEPGEIEAVVLDCPGVRSAAVVAHGDAGNIRLALFCSSDCDSAENDIRLAISTRLPSYMMPKTITCLAHWPTLPNGKTNIEHLAGLVREDAREIDSADMPKTFAERKIAKIWMDVLKVDDVSLNDDFFEIGGDSLKSIHVMLAAEKEGIRLEPFQIFENPCLGPLAASVSEAINVDLDEPDAELSCMIREQAKGATVVMVHGSQKMCAYLSATVGDDRALFYHFSAYSKGRLLDRNIHDAGERIVRRLLEKRPNGPYIVGGYSAGALIAVEVARRLKMLGCAPQEIFLLDPSWEFKGVVGPEGDFVRSGPFIRQLAIRSLTQVRIAKTKALRWMMPHKERYRTSLVGQQTRSQLLAHVAAALDEQARVYLSKESANLGLAEKWVNRVFVEPVYETLPYGHLELQSEEDALFEWCAKIARLLAEA